MPPWTCPGRPASRCCSSTSGEEAASGWPPPTTSPRREPGRPRRQRSSWRRSPAPIPCSPDSPHRPKSPNALGSSTPRRPRPVRSGGRRGWRSWSGSSDRASMLPGRSRPPPPRSPWPTARASSATPLPRRPRSPRSCPAGTEGRALQRWRRAALVRSTRPPSAPEPSGRPGTARGPWTYRPEGTRSSWSRSRSRHWSASCLGWGSVAGPSSKGARRSAARRATGSPRTRSTSSTTRSRPSPWESLSISKALPSGRSP